MNGIKCINALYSVVGNHPLKMTNFYLKIFIVILFTSCNTIQSEKIENSLEIELNTDSLVDKNKKTNNKDSIIIRELFIDSVNIGIKGNNKIETKLLAIRDSIFIKLDFFTLQNNKWIRKNHFEFGKDGITGIDPKISDFNNDSHNDFHYKASIAARGANDVRRLFIYDQRGDSLILIKNSLDYPNMIYNKKLDCIDAWLIHGCSSQAFLKTEKDSLIEFAWIQLSNGVNVYEVDKKGNKNELLNDSINQFGCYTRFSNYNPLIEYESYPN